MAKNAAGFLIFRRLNDQIEYLLLQTSYGKNHWTPPKGHVDKGEDYYTTALRETQEEAGYNSSDLKIYKDLSKTLNYKVKGYNKTVVYWLAEILDSNNNPKLSDEHIKFVWLPKQEAKDLSGFDDFAEMIDYFHEKIRDLKN